METKDRQTIQSSFADLVQNCRIDDLLPVLVEKNVFTSDMIYKYTDSRSRAIRNRDLFLDIPKRGPQAFVSLVSSLREIGQQNLANLLDPLNDQADNFHSSGVKHTHPFTLPINQDAQTHNAYEIQNIWDEGACINMSSERLVVNVKPSIAFHDTQRTAVPVYSTRSVHRGAVLIINIIKYVNDVEPFRRGADVDGESLEDLFTQMGMDVTYRIDLTTEEIHKEILAFSRDKKLRKVDLTIIIIMAHGRSDKQNTIIIGADGVGVNVSWIEDRFDNANCPALQNKPKIIIYQVCRGDFEDYGVSSRIETDSAPVKYKLRSRTDFLIAYSTLYGYQSHRDIYLGSWYIEHICRVFMEHAHDTHVEDMLKIVDTRLERLQSEKRTMQTSTYTSEGFKKCFFNPGIYLNEGQILSFNSDSSG